jgi:hypothetical protein
MKRDFRFYKTAQGDWYIDLPEWTGDREDLQMIQGADEWLDLLSEKEEVWVTIADVYFETAEFLTLIRLGEPNLGGGGNYFLAQYHQQAVQLKIWLCEVVEFIFNKYPQRIYFVVKN